MIGTLYRASQAIVWPSKSNLTPERPTTKKKRELGLFFFCVWRRLPDSGMLKVRCASRADAKAVPTRKKQSYANELVEGR